MSFFKRLFGGLLGGGSGGGDSAGADAFWVYVRCNACGEKIRVRINREHDLSAEFDGESDAPTSYTTSKEVVGQQCFRRIHVDLTFDGNRRLADQRITGGTFISRDEYDTPAPTSSE